MVASALLFCKDGICSSIDGVGYDAGLIDGMGWLNATL